MHNFTSIEDAFLYYTECQLATVEELLMKKSTTKSELRRHVSIARGMLTEALVIVQKIEAHVIPRGVGRVQDYISGVKTLPEVT